MNSNEQGTLTSAQERAAQLLARGSTARAVARELSVREQTISRWKQIPDFNAMIHEKGERIDRQVAAALDAANIAAAQAREEALSVVRLHLHSENPAIALKAAEILLKG